MTNEQRLGLWGGFRAKPLLLNTGNAYDRVPGTLHSTIAELAVFTCACQRVSSTAFSLLFILLTSQSKFYTYLSDFSESKSNICNLTARELGNVRTSGWAH